MPYGWRPATWNHQLAVYYQTDSNVSRQRLHPLWIATRDALAQRLTEYRSGLTPGQLMEVERELAQQRYQQMVLGNAAGLAVSLGMDDATIEAELPALLRDQTATAINDDHGRFGKSVRRARDRLRFVTNGA